MIEHYPNGGSAIPAEKAIGRIALVAAPFNWETFGPVGKIVRIEKDDFVVLAPMNDLDGGHKNPTGKFGTVEVRVNRRRVLILCDTVEEVQAFIDVGREASIEYHDALARTKKRNAELIANGLPTGLEPSYPGKGTP